MKKLLNTLYITSPGKYISLDGENIVVSEKEEELMRLPMHNIEAIITFGYAGASPALMGACSERNISISFLTPSGRFLARVTGRQRGNILLRREQYRIAGNEEESFKIAKNCIIGKLYNSKWVLERTCRDYPMRVDKNKLKDVSEKLSAAMIGAKNAESADYLRGIEGKAASDYFSVFDEMILQQKSDFSFSSRTRRPPLDPINAMLSFAYSLLTGMCSSALESVGLDPYEGFFHTERPGRASLALDMVEELRSVMADRFVLTLINKRIADPSCFVKKESGAVIMTDSFRKTFLSHWQSKKQEVITHPFLDEKVEWGMVPFAQALLLARYIRGDLDEYPPFFWK